MKIGDNEVGALIETLSNDHTLRAEWPYSSNGSILKSLLVFLGGHSIQFLGHNLEDDRYTYTTPHNVQVRLAYYSEQRQQAALVLEGTVDAHRFASFPIDIKQEHRSIKVGNVSVLSQEQKNKLITAIDMMLL